MTTPTNRRRFLGGTLAAATGLFLPRSAWARKSRLDPARWVLLADTHIWQHRDRENRGVRPAENFIRARDEILALQPRPAGILVAGDCAYNQGDPGDYAMLAELIEPIREAGIPVHFALGNHDNLENFRSAFPGATSQGGAALAGEHVAIVETPYADWFLLDSLQRSNHTPGRIGKAQLAWLAENLDARADKPALVVAHHNPDWAPKTSALEDTEALFDVLVPRRRVKAYFFGHTHRWELSQRENIHLVNLPTLVWVFDPSQPQGWVDSELHPGGIRLHLHTLKTDHPANRQRVELKWRV